MDNDITIVPPQSTALTMMDIFAQAVTDPSVDPEKLSALYRLKREYDRDEASIEARQAFKRVCAAMPRITKHGAIDFGKGAKPIPYAKWEDVQDAIRPIYEGENFTLRFNTAERTGAGGGLVVTAILTHDNGYEITSDFALPLDTSGGKQNIQGAGSTGSYGMRYATRNLFNLVFENEDDDGKRGGKRFVTAEQADQLRAKISEAGFQETDWLQRRAGPDITSADDVEQPAFVILMNMLVQIIAQRSVKKG